MEDTNELIQKIKFTHEEKYINKLFSLYENLIYYLVNNNTQYLHTCFSYDDAIQECRLEFMKCIDKYDFSYKFITYVTKCMKYAIIRESNRTLNKVYVPDYQLSKNKYYVVDYKLLDDLCYSEYDDNIIIDDILIQDIIPDDAGIDSEINRKLCIDNIVKAMDFITSSRNLLIVLGYYNFLNKHYNTIELATHFNVCNQRISSIINESISRMKRYVKIKHLLINDLDYIDKPLLQVKFRELYCKKKLNEYTKLTKKKNP